MRHLLLLYTVGLLCVLFGLPIKTSAESILENYERENISDEEYDRMASKFYKSEMVCEYDSIARQQISNYSSRAIENYTYLQEYSINHSLIYPYTYIQKILILAKENVYSAIPSYIIRYAHDIHNAFGCEVHIVSVNGETAPQIRALIQSYQTDLNGVVLIGDIAPAIYYHDTISTGVTNWKADHFPCDLYYMDLDGTWHLKNDGSGWYDGHMGNEAPEIFVGRINTATMGRDEIQELKYYFDKNHQYWTGKKVLNQQRALSFTGEDWDNVDFWDSVKPLYGCNNYDAVRGDLFTKGNYMNYLQNSNYEFVQLACHSNSYHHNFGTSSSPIYLSNLEISSLTTQQIGYNLFCCHACNWIANTSTLCLGESYLYGIDNNSSALTVIGSTKSGGMLNFPIFYNHLGNSKCIGQSYYLWWLSLGEMHSISEKLWFYGLTILGDPLIDFKYTNDCENNLIINSGEAYTNNMYYAQSKIEVRNYSITEGQSITLVAPTIEIKGAFICDSSTFIANPNDYCVCNTRISQMNSHYLLADKQKLNTQVISVYPNPVSNILTIETIEPISLISIYNQSGQCVMQTNESQINVTNLIAGIYIILVFTNDKCFKQKFIKK